MFEDDEEDDVPRAESQPRGKEALVQREEPFVSYGLNNDAHAVHTSSSLAPFYLDETVHDPSVRRGVWIRSRI